MPHTASRPHPLLLLVVGAVGGGLSGIFGVGGGIVLVPLLMLVAGLDQRRAAATSLLAILPSAIAGTVTYLAAGQVDIVAGLLIAAGAIVGSVLGANLLKRLSLEWLRWLFILMIVLVAVRMLLTVPERGVTLELSIPVALGYLALGLVMGLAAGLFGIGGGVIAVPALVAIAGISDLVAKGTSLLAIVPTSLSGTIANARNRLVQVRTGLIVGLAAAVASVGGSLLAQLLPPRESNLLFALLLVGIAVQLTVRALRARRPRKPEDPDAPAG